MHDIAKTKQPPQEPAFDRLDRVRLRTNHPKLGIPAGTPGTVVHVYKNAKRGYSVEITERARPGVFPFKGTDLEREEPRP